MKEILKSKNLGKILKGYTENQYVKNPILQKDNKIDKSSVSYTTEERENTNY